MNEKERERFMFVVTFALLVGLGLSAESDNRLQACAYDDFECNLNYYETGGYLNPQNWESGTFGNILIWCAVFIPLVITKSLFFLLLIVSKVIIWILTYKLW